MKSNYRSKKNIIDFNNSFFKLSKHKLTSEEYRRVYDNLEQDCPKNYDYDGLVSVEIFDMSKFEDDDSTVKSYKDAVKRSILNDVGELLCKGFRYRDITVLVRSNSDGSQIAEFLSENNIPVISSDSILLKSSDKVRLIILTLKYLSDDKNNVTRLALSFYKNVCADAGECDIQKALEDTFDKDEIYRIRNRAYSLYDLCDNIIKMYGFNVIEDEFLQYFMDLVQEWQNSENNGVNAFVEYWEKKSDTFFVKIAGDIDAVQVMTIHKSKGLEFKVVMYPYAYTKVPDRMRGNEKWLSSDEFELLKEVPHVDDFILPISKSLVDTKMEKHYAEEVDKAAFDDFNIMYVAMTRPSDLIYIYTNNKTKDDSYNFFTEYFSVPQNGYKSEKLEVVVEQEDVDFINRFECIEKEQSARFVIGNVHYIKEEKKKCSKILELDEKSVPQSLEWTDVLEIEPDPTMFWMEDEKEFLPQEWGNLVHDILSKINTVDDADKVLRNYINEGSIDHHIAELLREQFEVIFNIKEIKEAYSKDAIVRNEMDILINDKYNGNVIIRPDRYAELSDRVLLIDYKTGSHHEKYYEQLRNYVVALQDMGVKKNIEAYLLYLGENIEIKPVFLDRLF